MKYLLTTLVLPVMLFVTAPASAASHPAYGRPAIDLTTCGLGLLPEGISCVAPNANDRNGDGGNEAAPEAADKSPEADKPSRDKPGRDKPGKRGKRGKSSESHGKKGDHSAGRGKGHSRGRGHKS